MSLITFGCSTCNVEIPRSTFQILTILTSNMYNRDWWYLFHDVEFSKYRKCTIRNIYEAGASFQWSIMNEHTALIVLFLIRTFVRNDQQTWSWERPSKQFDSAVPVSLSSNRPFLIVSMQTIPISYGYYKINSDGSKDIIPRVSMRIQSSIMRFEGQIIRMSIN